MLQDKHEWKEGSVRTLGDHGVMDTVETSENSYFSLVQVWRSMEDRQLSMSENEAGVIYRLNMESLTWLVKAIIPGPS